MESLVHEWRQLCERDPNATPFQRPEWLLPWWRHVGEGELFCILLRGRDGSLVGLLPMYIYTQPLNGERHLLLLGAGTSDYLDGIFAPEALGNSSSVLEIPLQTSAAINAEFLSRPQIANSALQFLARPTSQWDRLILHQLRETSLLLHCARDAGWLVGTAEACSSVRVEGWSRLPPKLRLNRGRYRRRAETRGELRFAVATSAEDALARLNRLLDLQIARWKDRGAGIVPGAAVQEHHRESVPKLLQAGLLRMLAVELDGQTIAVLYALVDGATRDENASCGRRMFCYQIGFDSAFADLSPGTLVLSFAFDCCEAEGIRELDLLRGGETYKRLWGAVPEPTYSIALP